MPLVWAWKDEEMHAIYIRGALLKLGGPLLRAQTFARQFAGAVGGWSSSVRLHVQWSEAPFSRALATLITWAGVATGKVPRDVKQHLDYGSFRDFCFFNIDAEKDGLAVLETTGRNWPTHSPISAPRCMPIFNACMG